MLTRLFPLTSLLLLTLLATGCRRSPGIDGIRTPVWVLGGEGVAHAERFDTDSPRYDLYLATSEGSERLLKRVDTGSLHPRAVSPDGRRLALIAGTTSHPSLFVVSLPDGDRERLIRDVDLRPETIAWDAEGRWLAVSHRSDAMFFLFDTVTDARNQIPSTCPRVLSWLPVSPPTLLLATDREPQEGNQIAMWVPSQPGTPPQELFRTPGAGRIKTAVANPQGTQLAILTSDTEFGHTALTIMDLQTRQSHQVWDSPRPLVGLQWSPEGDAVYLTQLSREHDEGWILHRVNLATLSPEALVEHGPGWALSPNGQQVVIAPGSLQRLRVFDLQPRQ